MFVDVHLHPPKIHSNLQVLLDGQDITKDVYACDDKKGIALCYCKDENGLRMIRGNKLVRELRRGNIRMRVKEQ